MRRVLVIGFALLAVLCAQPAHAAVSFVMAHLTPAQGAGMLRLTPMGVKGG